MITTVVSEVLRVLRAKQVEDVELVKMLGAVLADTHRSQAPWAARHGREEMLITREQFEALQLAGARLVDG